MTDQHTKTVAVATIALAAMRLAKVFNPDYQQSKLYYVHERLEKAIQANPDDADAVERFCEEIDELHEKTFPKKKFPPGGVISKP